MLGILFKPYPDEIALSWFIRYHCYSGNRKWQHTSEDLFGKKVHNPNVLYALYLDFICSQIPKELQISLDYIIENMTVFPFYKPFMSLERANSIIKGMREGNAIGLNLEMGINTGSIFLKDCRVIKICKACLEDDEVEYDEPYIHRIHQMPGNFMCNKHNVPLSYFLVPNYNNLGIHIDSLNGNELASYKIKPNLAQYYSLLGKDIEFLLRGGLSNFSIDTVRQRYMERLQEKGYVLTGRIKQSRLLADFKQFYPFDFLESLESDFANNSRGNWIKLMLDTKRFIHPIRHLLFIRFLFGGIKEFISYSFKFKPFGDAPYPCLNSVADHYKKEVIEQCEIKRTHSILNPVGVFKCDCGFVYCRTGPDKTKNDRLRLGKVIQYGHVWEDKLKVLINNNSSIVYIAKEMRCSKNTVIKYATLLGIVDKLNTKKRIMPKKHCKRISDEGLNVYKEEIIQYIIDNPDASRGKIKKALTKQYSLLVIRDKQWLEEILPQPLKRGGAKLKKEWKSRDEEVLKTVKLIVREELLKEKPRRITRNYIASKTRYYGIILTKKLTKNLPKTEEYLLSCCETVEDFKKRKASLLKIK